jgi:hypothetical protein
MLLRFRLWLRLRLTRLREFLRCDRLRRWLLRLGFLRCVRLRLRLRFFFRPLLARRARLRLTEDASGRLRLRRLRVTRLAARLRGFRRTRRARLRRFATSFFEERLRRLRLTVVFAAVLRLRLRVTRLTDRRATRRFAPLRLRLATSFRERLRLRGAAVRLADARLLRLIVLVFDFLVLRMAAPWDPFRVTPRASRARRFRFGRLRRVVLGVALPPERRAAARRRTISAKRSRAASCFAVGREFRLMGEPPEGRRAAPERRRAWAMRAFRLRPLITRRGVEELPGRRR